MTLTKGNEASTPAILHATCSVMSSAELGGESEILPQAIVTRSSSGCKFCSMAIHSFNNEIFKTLEEAIMETWGPVHERRRSSLSAGKLLGGKSADSKPVPATSSTLANGSTTPPEEELAANNYSTQQQPRKRKPLYIREGGSIPSIRFLEKEFDAPAAHLPCGQASDCAHLDNERLRLVNLYNAKGVFRRVFREV